MFVRDYMTRHPVMVESSTSVVEAQGIMAEAKIRHLPVTGKGKRLQGLVTRQRLRIAPTDLGSLNVWEISRVLSDLNVKDVMIKRKDVVTTIPEAPLEQAAEVMVVHRIGCLPVLEDEVVIGIITEVDMLRQLTSVLGLEYPGVRATVRVPDRQGETAKITGAIAKQGWGIWATGAVPSPKHPGHWDIVIKVQHVSVEEVSKVLEKIPDQQLLDIRDTR